MKPLFALLLMHFCTLTALSQDAQDTTLIPLHNPADSVLRIKNLNPFYTLHVDSTLRYQFVINKPLENYYWFLTNSPVGLKINKDNGMLTFKAEKSYFLSGRLKYDFPYKVTMRVQNLDAPEEKVDTGFSITFYSTEIVNSRVKPTVTNTLFIDEGDTVNFKLQCENGNFPIERITYMSNYSVKSLTPVTRCGDDFTWVAPFDFVKETDKEKTKKIDLFFIGSNKFHIADTAGITIVVKENINYPQQVMEFERLQVDTRRYIVSLKSSFRLVDKKN